MTYDARAAWHRAGIYFAVCLGLSAISGVLGRLFDEPIVRAGQTSNPAWVALALASIAVVAVAYLVVWPRGTLTHGRALHLPSVLLFGALWGVCEGQLLLAMWSVADRLVTPDWFVVTISFVLISTWLGVWHARYWDIQVAPEHNIPEWNLRKVAFAHTPNLLVSLTFLTLYENLAIFLALQTFALMASTSVMRFPRYSRGC